MAKQKVNKYTRATKNGKVIYCPKCNKGTKVYHFSWIGLTCFGCKEMINKYDFLLKARQYRSNQGKHPNCNVISMKLIMTGIIGIGILMLYLIINQI